MAVQSKVGSFSTGTGAAATTVAVTGLGFVPKVLLFWWGGHTESVTTGANQTQRRGFGFGTGTTSRHCVTGFSAHASAVSDTQKAHRDDACVARINGSGTDEGRLDVQSLDADGFTLVVDLQFTVSMRIAYQAIGGDSITNQGTELITASAATGNVDYTGLGFTPAVIIVIGCGLDVAPPNTNTDSHFQLGWATGSAATANGKVVAGSDNAVDPSWTRFYTRSQEVIGRINSALTGVTGRANLAAFIANGYRLNWIEADSAGASTIRYSVLGIAGLSAAVGVTASRTDTNDIVITGLGFKPAAVTFLSGMDFEVAEDAQNFQDTWSVGAGDGTNMVCHAGWDRDGLGTTDIATMINFENVYLDLTTTSTVDGSMQLSTLDADGFTTKMTDPDFAALWISYLALGPFGAAPAAGGPPGPNALMLLGVGQ